MIHEAIPDDLKNLKGYQSPYIAGEVANLLRIEREYLTSFYCSVSEFRQQKTNFDLLDAQHRGLPTRLLDWSENPLVALYFATEPNECDGYLFALGVDPNSIWRGGDPLDSSGGQNAPSIIDMNIDVWFPTRIGQRISRQLGCFTLHKVPWIAADHDYETNSQTGPSGQKDLNFTIQAPRIQKHTVKKFIIPEDAKANLRNELSALGINKKSLWLYSEDTLEDKAKEELKYRMIIELATRC